MKWIALFVVLNRLKISNKSIHANTYVVIIIVISIFLFIILKLGKSDLPKIVELSRNNNERERKKN